MCLLFNNCLPESPMKLFSFTISISTSSFSMLDSINFCTLQLSLPLFSPKTPISLFLSPMNSLTLISSLSLVKKSPVFLWRSYSPRESSRFLSSMEEDLLVSRCSGLFSSFIANWERVNFFLIEVDLSIEFV